MAIQAQQAAENLKSFLNKLKGVIQVAEALEEIGLLEQRKREADKEKEDAEKERAESIHLLDEVKINLSKHQEILAKNQAQSDLILSDAESRYERIIAAAREKATEIKSIIDKEASNVKDQLNVKKEEYNLICSNIDKRKKELLLLEQQLNSFKKEMKQKMARLV